MPQGSLHAIVTNASSWRGTDPSAIEKEAMANMSRGRSPGSKIGTPGTGGGVGGGGGSRGRTPAMLGSRGRTVGSRQAAPTGQHHVPSGSPPRRAANSSAGNASRSKVNTASKPTPAVGARTTQTPGRADVLSVNVDQSASMRSSGGLSHGGLSVSLLDLDGISPIGKPTSAAATATQQQQQLTWQQAGPAPQPVTPGLPSAGLQTVSSRASLNISRAYDPAQAFGLSGRASAKNAPPLQAALLQRPSAITKLAPNTFLPSHVRGLIAAPGEAHFAHTSRFGGGMA